MPEQSASPGAACFSQSSVARLRINPGLLSADTPLPSFSLLTTQSPLLQIWTPPSPPPPPLPRLFPFPNNPSSTLLMLSAVPEDHAELFVCLFSGTFDSPSAAANFFSLSTELFKMKGSRCLPLDNNECIYCKCRPCREVAGLRKKKKRGFFL